MPRRAWVEHCRVRAYPFDDCGARGWQHPVHRLRNHGSMSEIAYLTHRPNRGIAYARESDARIPSVAIVGGLRVDSRHKTFG